MPRIAYVRVAPDAAKALYGVHTYNQGSTVEASLRCLVELRVSQINGCAFCIDMHSQEARKLGERQQRLDCLPAWRETDFFTDREQAALEWAETVTLVAQTHVPDEVYDRARRHFTEKELVDLTMVVVSINAWNRMAVSFRVHPTAHTETDGPKGAA